MAEPVSGRKPLLITEVGNDASPFRNLSEDSEIRKHYVNFSTSGVESATVVYGAICPVNGRFRRMTVASGSGAVGSAVLDIKDLTNSQVLVASIGLDDVNFLSGSVLAITATSEFSVSQGSMIEMTFSACLAKISIAMEFVIDKTSV